MHSIRAIGRVTVSNNRLLAAVGGIVLIEGLVRGVLVGAMDRHFGILWLLLAAVGWPPIVTVLGLATLVSTARKPIGDGTTGEATWDERLGTGIVRTPALVAIALLGHGFALVGGAVLFVLVDTPVRYVLYWAGYGDTLFTFEVAMFGPFVGIAIGAIVAWTIPAIAVVSVAAGSGIVGAVRRAIASPAAQPRAVAAMAVGNLLAGGLVVGGILATRVSFDSAGRMRAFGPVLEVAIVVIGGLCLLAGVTVLLSGTCTYAVDRFTRTIAAAEPTPDATDRTRRSIPVVHLALVVLVVTALVSTAGAVRVNEIRPIDTEPEPLPDDADDLYVTAFENTDRTSHEFRWYSADDSGELPEEPSYEFRIDRDDRQAFADLDGIETYATTGALSMGGEPFPLPGYAMLAEGPRIGEPNSETRNWTIAAEEADEIVLELTDPADVYFAATGEELAEFADDPEVNESRAQLTVDAERGTLSHGELRLNLTDRNDPDTVYDVHTTFEFDVGTDVDRPATLDSPGVGERLWQLFVY